jgi:hypothetical protein
MARGVSRCPKCGEPVSQFAAGCAICGTDLIAARAERERRQRSVAALPGRLRNSLPRIGDDPLKVAIAALVVLFAPLFGALLAGFFAYQAHNDGQTGVRNVMLALSTLGVLFLAFPIWWWRVVPGY